VNGCTITAKFSEKILPDAQASTQLLGRVDFDEGHFLSPTLAGPSQSTLPNTSNKRKEDTQVASELNL
jgi:hypothetical protein